MQACGMKRTLGMAALIAVVGRLLCGCATASCDTEAREAAASLGPKKAAAVRAKCEQDLAAMRQRVKSQEEQREVEERRNAFTNRARALAGSPR